MATTYRLLRCRKDVAESDGGQQNPRGPQKRHQRSIQSGMLMQKLDIAPVGD
jgi:hypothetical protein